MRKASRPGLLAFLCLALFTAHAQQKKPSPTPKPAEEEDVVRINTDLVQTDVMVFDKQGKFVNGLKPEQFELLIDGQPAPIAFFDSVETGARNERAALRAARDNTPAPPVEIGLSGGGTGYRSALAKLSRSIAPVPEALMPRALMLTSHPSACARSAPTVQFSRPRTENGSNL